MDFLTLTRKELQALCKLNKIPANITNIAMADALNSLDIVEGIEEIFKPSESETAQSSIESPEKKVLASPIVPRTGCRTTTRGKGVKEETESSQLFTRSRRVTRRTLAGEVEEAKNGVPETPAAPSTRKRGPAASARRKMETQSKESEDRKLDEHSRDLKEATAGRRVYSTRRSVRLSEKNVGEPNMKNTEAIKIASFCKEISKVSDNISMSGVELQNISEEGYERSKDSEVSSQNLTASLETKRASDDDDQEEAGGGDSKATLEEVSEVFNEMHLVADEDEHVNKSIVEKERDVENNDHGSHDDDSAVDSLLSRTENPSKVLKLENKEVSNTDNDMRSEDSAAEEFSCDVMNAISPQSSAKNTESENMSASVGDDDRNPVTELELGFQEEINGKDSADDIETDHELYEIQVLESELAFERSTNCKVSDNDEETHSVLPEQIIQDCEEFKSDENQLMKDSDNATDHLVEIRVDNELDFEKFVTEDSDILISEDNLADQLASQECTKAANDRTPKIEKSSEPAWGFGVYGNAENEFKMAATHKQHNTSASVKQSPLSLSQARLDLECIIPRPASVTPAKKSSSKTTPTKIRGLIMTIVSDDKENIDNSGRKLDITTDKGIKKKKDAAEDNNGLKSLNEASLRLLSKMLKEKLQISNNGNNNNEEKNNAKVEKVRPALQRLPENRLATGGPEKEN